VPLEEVAARLVRLGDVGKDPLHAARPLALVWESASMSRRSPRCGPSPRESEPDSPRSGDHCDVRTADEAPKARIRELDDLPDSGQPDQAAGRNLFHDPNLGHWPFAGPQFPDDPMHLAFGPVALLPQQKPLRTPSVVGSIVRHRSEPPG